MGKYSSVVDGKVHDWKFTRSASGSPELLIWNFFLGETFIGQLFKLKKSGWCPAVHHTPCPFGGVDGFATRFDAAMYMLQVCGFVRKPNQEYKPTEKDPGYIPVKADVYIELIKTKRKLEELELDASWTESPERMGS